MNSFQFFSIIIFSYRFKKSLSLIKELIFFCKILDIKKRNLFFWKRKKKLENEKKGGNLKNKS